jgi:hypothetical protein
MGLFDKEKAAPNVGAAVVGTVIGAAAVTTFVNSNELDENVVVTSADSSEPISESSGDDVGQSCVTPNWQLSCDPPSDNTESFDDISPDIFNTTEDLISTTSANSSEATSDRTVGRLFNHIKEINADIPDPLKAAGLGIPDRPVQEFRTYKEGSLEDGQVRYGYEARAGRESTYHTAHSGQNEILPGATLNSTSTYDAGSFMGAYSKGEAGVEWNPEEAHLYAQRRSMVGAEANVNAGYNGTLDIEGVNHQLGAEAQGYAKSFAGAEVEDRIDLNVSSDGAYGRIGGEAFAGAKAEVGGSGAISIDGNDFARGEGGIDARAGVGAGLDMGLGYQDGQIKYGGNMSIAAGAGVGIHYNGSVDAPGIITHPDAVLESAVKEVNSYVPEIPSFSVNPSTYTNQVEHYVTQQAQNFLPSVPQEVTHVAEVINDPVSALEDFGNSFFG